MGISRWVSGGGAGVENGVLGVGRQMSSERGLSLQA